MTRVPLPEMIARTQTLLAAAIRDRPRSRRRIELELQLRELRTKQLRGEIRKPRRKETT